MPMLNVFQQDAFSAVSLSDSILERPFVPSRLRDMGLFSPRGIMTKSVAIEKKGTTLSLVQTSERGAPPESRTRDKRDIRDLRVPHLAKEATVYAEQVQDVRSFGSETELEVVQSVVNEEVENVASEIDMTEENLMLGAVKGTILDADGSVIYNLFDEFDVTQVTPINFALGTSGTKVRGKCQQVRRTMSQELKAGNMPFRIHALCGDAFFDALISHQDVKEAYERYQDGAMLRADLTYDVFPFAGIMFENYRGSDDGDVGVADDEAHFFPVGVPNLFRIVYAPSPINGIVNSMGRPRYVLPNLEDTGNGRYQKFEVQANPLPYCTRPRTLIKGTRTS